MLDRERSCAAVGLGNIGSHAAPLVARLPVVGRMVLVDFDEVERGNLATQSVREADVGRSKVGVMRRSIGEARRELDLVAHARPLEDVPLGELRADVLLSGLDSRAARMALNERAVALGVPWVDAGVSASGLLVRVSVFGVGGPCLECTWDEDAYAHVETVHACSGAIVARGSTSAPAFLGATAAALQVAACAEILHGATDLCGRETVLDLEHGKLIVSSVRARPTCRMAPHRRWPIGKLEAAPQDLRIQDALDLGPSHVPERERSIACSRGPFALKLRCAGCGEERPILRLAASLARPARRCRRCGGDMQLGGMDLCERLEAGALSRTERARSLASLGARAGDVLTVGAGEAVRHFELGQSQPAGTVAEVKPC